MRVLVRMRGLVVPVPTELLVVCRRPQRSCPVEVRLSREGLLAGQACGGGAGGAAEVGAWDDVVGLVKKLVLHLAGRGGEGV